MAFRSAFAATLLLWFFVTSCTASDACGEDFVRSRYDVGTLVSASSWHINRYCLWPREIGGKCSYYFAFDRPLSFIPGCESASACAVYENGSSVIIGTYDKNTNEFCRTDRGGVTFLGVLGNGEVFNATSNFTRLSMILEFVCEKSADWYIRPGNSSEVPAKAIENFLFHEASAEYVLRVRYEGACYEEVPIDVPMGISVGSVLLIILVCIVAVYFGFGSIINYSSGKRGVEILPNASLWSQLPDNVKAGFSFSLSCLKSPGGLQTSTTPQPSHSDTSAFANESRYGTI